MGIVTLVSTGIIQNIGKSEYIELTKGIGSVLTEKGKTMNDLKPCPFCGRKVRLVNVSEVGFKCDIWVIVHEEKEPVCFLWHNKGYEGKKKDIVKLWNQRS